MRALCGQRLGHYQIKELIGAGGMGEVYRALDEQLDREVAVKVLPERTALDADAINRFKREAKAVAALSHPSILAIHDFGQEGDLCYAVTELLDGETLDQRLSRGPLDAEGVVEISLAIAEALAAAHDRGIVHRDLKPKNVFLTTAGGVKLLDFGLARITTGGFDQTLTFHDSNTQSGTVLGTPHYMSPEQVRGATVDHHSDLFSFGTVLFEMGTGSHPFAHETAAETMTAILNDPPLKSERALPAPLHSLVERCLQKSPAARFQSAREVVTILKEARSGSHRVLASTAAPPRGRLAWILAAGVLAVAVTGLLAWRSGVGTGKSPPKPPIAATVPSEAEIARQEYLPKIIQYADAGEFLKAWDLAVKAQEVIPNDPILNGLWDRFSLKLNVTTTPPGAEVFVRDYDAVDNVWTSLGKTPIEGARVSLGLKRRLEGAGISQGLKRWRIVKDGSATLEFAWVPTSLDIELPAASLVPPEMVYVPKGKNRRSGVVKLVGMPSSGPDPELDAFLIDRHEVSNKQFKEFIDRGGYRNRALWKHEFDKDGETLPWEEAMKLFLDATGRPGPAAWALGEYPNGADNLPVTGVSWHEAAAYAESVNKRLPTVYHWMRAANVDWAEFIIPQSNIEGESIAPVGTFPGIAAFGCYDMAGNVWEWASNTVNDRYVSLGGSWTDKAYMFCFPQFNSCFDRNATTGFRCVRLLGDGALSSELAGPILVVKRDYGVEKPSDDTSFAVYQRQFDYDPGELEPRVEPQGTTPTERDAIWNREIITVNAAYDNERLKLHLFLPKRGRPPFQTVVFFPGTGSINPRAVVAQTEFIFIVKSGRAVVYPIYKGTHDRNDGLKIDENRETTRYADYLVKWVKDLRRSLDYVATRPELDGQRVAYYGRSWGGRMGAIIPAVEPRIRVSVLALGGLPQSFSRPEVDPLNFAPRVTIPTLMLNGRYDSIFPVDECQLPLLRLLGTPPEHKRHMIYDTAHAVPQNELIKETLNWLDRYLGPVESQESVAVPPP